MASDLTTRADAGTDDSGLLPDAERPAHYRAMPQELTLREVEVGGHVLVTSQLDPRTTCKRALGELYQKRWHIERDLRRIKTTLGMEVLRCLSAELVEKELWVYLLAYNLIRLLMALA